MAFETPNFRFPFQFTPGGGRVQYREQDTDDEIMDSIEVLLLTPQGERIDIPNYGVPDQTFQMNGANLAAIQTAIELWEERADVTVDDEGIVDLVHRVQVNYTGADEDG